MKVMFETIGRYAEQRPQNPAIIGTDEVIGFGRLRQRITDVSEQLRAARLQTLGIYLDNGPDWIVIDLACQHAGITAIPLPQFFSADQLAYICRQAGVQAIVVDVPFPAAGQLAGLENDNVLEGFRLLRMPALSDAAPLSGIAKITFTSGTTGTPKGVLLTRENMETVARSLVTATQNCQIESHLNVLPLPVLLENIAGVYAPLLTGAACIALPLAQVGMHGSAGFSPDSLLTALNRYRPHSLILLPQLLQVLVQAAEAGATLADSLRFIAVGGARVAPSLLQRAWRCKLPVYEGYGLSECASVVTLNTRETCRPGSVGRVLDHASISVAGDGELMIQGNAFAGYLGEAETKSGNADALASGDLGRIDSDGFVYISGRKKNLLITSYGRNISPEWPESELLQSGAIVQAAVFGDARPFCCALLVPASADVSHDQLTAAVSQANGRLPDYARIIKWLALSQPFSLQNGLATANGRLQRDAIAALYAPSIEHFYRESA